MTIFSLPAETKRLLQKDYPGYELLYGVPGHLLGFREETAYVDNMKIPYLVGGNGPETVVCLHGYMADRYNFLFFASSLKKRYRVILPDMPGFGEADRPVGVKFSLSFFAGVMLNLLQTRSFGKVHIVGNSLGGAVSVKMADLKPDMVHSLYIINSAGLYVPGSGDLFDELAMGLNPFLTRNLDAFKKFIRRRVVAKRIYIPGIVMKTMYDRMDRDRKILTDIMRDLTENRNETLEKELKILRKPVLIGWGTKDGLLSLDLARKFQRLVKNSVIAFFNGNGHCPQVENPWKTAQLYKSFLNSPHNPESWKVPTGVTLEFGKKSLP